MVYTAITSLIVALRGTRRQADLGALLGVTQAAVSRWETGNVPPPPAMLQKILDIGGADPTLRAQAWRLLAEADAARRPPQAQQAA